MRTVLRLSFIGLMMAICTHLTAPAAQAAVRLVNITGKAFTVDIQTPSQRLKDLSLPAGFNPAQDYKTPPGGTRYSLSIILKSPEGEWRVDGQDNGVYLVRQTHDAYTVQFMGYMKKDASLMDWVKVENATSIPMNLELFFPNGDSKKHSISPADSYSFTPGYATFSSGEGPHVTPGEKRSFELKSQDGRSLYKGTTSQGQVYLVTPGAGDGCTVNAIGVE